MHLPDELQLLVLVLLISACITLFFGAVASFTFMAGCLGTRIMIWLSRAEKKTDEPT